MSGWLDGIVRWEARIDAVLAVVVVGYIAAFLLIKTYALRRTGPLGRAMAANNLWMAIGFLFVFLGAVFGWRGAAWFGWGLFGLRIAIAVSTTMAVRALVRAIGGRPALWAMVREDAAALAGRVRRRWRATWRR